MPMGLLPILPTMLKILSRREPFGKDERRPDGRSR